MAKKPKKPKFESTLAFAYDTEDRLEPEDIFLFQAIHEPGIPAHEIKLRLRGAFFDWSKTEEGEEYIEDNGTNWGDATEIPTKFLVKHGIYSYTNAEAIHANGREVKVFYHQKIIVNHNESLI